MSYKQQQTESKGRIAIIGERELVIGYRLLGVDDTFIVTGGDESFKTMENLFFSPARCQR